MRHLGEWTFDLGITQMTNLPLDRRPGSLRRSTLYAGFLLLAVAFIFFSEVLLPIADALVLGWGRCLVRFARTQPLHREKLIAFALGLIALTAGFHFFAKWLHLQMNGAIESRWRVRSTIVIVTLIMVFFLSGICVLGVCHQSAWLATDPEGVWLRSWDYFS